MGGISAKLERGPEAGAGEIPPEQEPEGGELGASRGFGTTECCIRAPMVISSTKGTKQRWLMICQVGGCGCTVGRGGGHGRGPGGQQAADPRLLK